MKTLKCAYVVEPQDADFQRKMTVSALGGRLLETASENASAKGFGIHFLQKNGCTWVLKKLAVELFRPLAEGEPFSVETWVENVEKLTSVRNFRIFDGDGNLAGEASSVWVMLDLNTRRPVDLLALTELAEAVVPERVTIAPPARLQPLGEEPSRRVHVRYSDIDINAHVNSLRYIQWICDMFPLDFYRNHNWSRFEINYMSEALFGDEISVVRKDAAPDDCRFDLRRGGETICRARVLWKKK